MTKEDNIDVGNVINLNKQRKLHRRAAKERRSQENRVRFGRTKAEKAADDQRSQENESVVEIHRLDDDKTSNS